MGLDRIFKAESVAVVGASLDETKRGYQAIKTLKNEKYEGVIYPVNPKLKRVLGYKCYSAVSDIEGDVDLVLITTPAKTVASIMEDCGQKGVGGVVIIAGGFGELGSKGKTVENEIIAVARKYNIRVVGPNTSGMISVKNNLNLVGLKDVPSGNIALLSQSGNIALNLITEASLKSQMGFSHYVGVGNEADIKFHEYLEYFKNDPETRAIVMYVEGLREGRKFLQEAYKTTPVKPIILLKSGRSSIGKKSAGSHTGALAGISEVARTAFKRAGIINIEYSDELFPAAETLASLPPIKNNNIAILADGGGHATIAADRLTDMGVHLPQLQEKTRKKLKAILPPSASVVNPIDVAGGTDNDPAIFAECARILLADKDVGGLLIVGLFGGYGIRFSEKLAFIEEDAAHQMGKLVTKTGKPIVLHSLYNFARPHSLDLMRYYDIPVYDSLDIACNCMAVLCQYGNFVAAYHRKTSFVMDWKSKAKKKGEAIINSALNEKRYSLYEHHAKELLAYHGAPVSQDRLAKTADEAVKIAEDLGYNVALKIVSPDILHKSDAGGVKLNCKNEKHVRDAFHQIMKNAGEYNAEAAITGCIVSRMSGDGVEVIIGTKIDEQFGPIMMFGLGGILVEVVKDVSFRVLPVSKNSAGDMVEEIKSAPILNGVRGKAPVDKKALINLILTVSEVVEAYPKILEMDLNPVIVHEDGLTVVDARIILDPDGVM